MWTKKGFEETTDRKSFLKGAFWIAFGGFAAKLIGAFYRIPLTNLIGGYGLGLYQMVYPIYCLLLTVSATGIPSSIAKLTAEQIALGNDGQEVLSKALKLFLWVGLIATLIMALSAPVLSKAQDSRSVLGGYFMLAPSVLLVSALSVFRGWFQGKNNMFPTAISEIVEQVVKVGFGLLFAYIFRTEIERAVVFLLLAVTISEAVTLLLMFCFYKRVHAPIKHKNNRGMVEMKRIVKLTIPVTFNAILLPLSTLLDSILVPRVLGVYETSAVTLYGLFAGGAVTVVSLPVAVCYGLAAASIPRIAAAARIQDFDERKRTVRKRLRYSFLVTFSVGAFSALGLYVFAEPAAKLIFRSLMESEQDTLIALIKAYSISALSLSCVQTLSACLTAQGKPQYAALSMLIAVTVKTLCYVVWLRNENLSIFGLAYAMNVCYLVAFFLDFMYNRIVSGRREGEKT